MKKKKRSRWGPQDDQPPSVAPAGVPQAVGTNGKLEGKIHTKKRKCLKFLGVGGMDDNYFLPLYRLSKKCGYIALHSPVNKLLSR